jgi:hypothetical protein
MSTVVNINSADETVFLYRALRRGNTDFISAAFGQSHVNHELVPGNNGAAKFCPVELIK